MIVNFVVLANILLMLVHLQNHRVKIVYLDLNRRMRVVLIVFHAHQENLVKQMVMVILFVIIVQIIGILKIQRKHHVKFVQMVEHLTLVAFLVLCALLVIW